jgi:hypothetical protein
VQHGGLHDTATRVNNRAAVRLPVPGRRPARNTSGSSCTVR